jgi:hypothetical protein
MPECPGSHCSSPDVLKGTNETCIADGFSGTVVYTTGPDGKPCYCKCSCLAHNTLVAVSSNSWKKIQDFQVGDNVLTLDSDNTWKESKVAFSDGTKGDGNPVPYVIYICTDTNIELIVTSDHPFLLENGKLQRANRLTLQDKLVDENFQPIGIQQIGYGVYTGGIHNISTSKGGPGEPLNEHLINTAGVISGDYYAQLFLVEQGLLSQPLVGSVEYQEKYKLSEITFRAEISEQGLEIFKFIPFKKVESPAGAKFFLPSYMETPVPESLRPFDDSVPLEIAEYLVNHFKRFYPNIVYHIEWLDNTVNASAWKEGDERHVRLYGGLIRHKAIKQEGLGLVLAHEIGHHYAGTPTYPNSDLSCEGQADYWAAKIAMREVWWGEEYIQQVQAGADQLYDLFKNGLLMTISPEEEANLFISLEGCSHPPAECRRDTYLAALRLASKPTCAG